MTLQATLEPTPKAELEKIFPQTLDGLRTTMEDRPDNVPGDRVVNLSVGMDRFANDLADPYEPFHWLAGEDIPRLLFVPSNDMTLAAVVGGADGSKKGNWVVTHYEDINRVYSDNDHFSNSGTAEFQRLIGETFRSIPLAVDPPEHSQYRMFLWPHCTPATITRGSTLKIKVAGFSIGNTPGTNDGVVRLRFTGGTGCADVVLNTEAPMAGSGNVEHALPMACTGTDIVIRAEPHLTFKEP